jgi:hypothetical protein
MGTLTEVLRGLKSYRLPGKKATVMLACEKCQRKQKKRGGELRRFARLVKDAGREQGAKVRVVDVPCMDLCPKDGVVVVTPAQLLASECSIVRQGEEVRGLVAALLHGKRSPAAGALEDVQQHEQHDDEQHRSDATRAVVTP